MSHSPSSYLAVVGDRRAAAWILSYERLAFPEPRFPTQFHNLLKGDEVFVYATRGCFGNPTRDRGRVIARATAAADMNRNDDPVEFQDRVFPHELGVKITALAPWGEGPILADFATAMTSFAKPDRWRMYLRRSLLKLTGDDAALLNDKLKNFAGQLNDNRNEYQVRGRTGIVYAPEGDK